MMHGRGVYVKADGERYEGEYRDGKRHGRGVMVKAEEEQRRRKVEERRVREGTVEAQKNVEKSAGFKFNKRLKSKCVSEVSSFERDTQFTSFQLGLPRCELELEIGEVKKTGPNSYSVMFSGKTTRKNKYETTQLCSTLRGYCIIPHAEILPSGRILFDRPVNFVGMDGQDVYAWQIHEPHWEEDRR